MVNFITDSSKTNTVKISLVENKNCIDLYFNDIVIGWFSRDRGDLTLNYITGEHRSKLPGVCFNNGNLKVEKC